VRTGIWSGLLTVLAGFWLIVLAGLPLYVFPPVDAVEPSDAVLVLGPPMEPRLELAEQLRDEGLADRIVISVQASGGQTAEDLPLCQDEGVTCAVASPSSTWGEVRLMKQSSDGAEPPSLIVLTQVAHVARTRYLFAKCYPGEVTVVPVGGPSTLSQWTSQYVYQSAAFVKALFQACP
jgi:hypothetical protein